MEAHPEIAYEADKRVQAHLTALLEEEPGLADFFHNYQTRVKRECQSRAEQLAELAERRQNELLLRQQTEREQLVAEIAQRIRGSLNLEKILSTTVSEVRQFLQSERVFIYRFEPDWSGFVAVESVEPGWSSILGTKIKDSFFGAAACRELYHQGRIQATADIYAAGLSKCHLDLLTRLQVRGSLVVPILQGEQLWGLLVANQCSAPRQWQQLEISLLKQLATQVAIAIQQSELYQQVQTELSERKRSEAKIREQAALLDITTDAIFVRTLDDRILFWNQAAEQIYGWLAAEALVMSARELLAADTLPQLEQVRKTVIATGGWQGELHQVTKSDKEILVESRWTLVRDEAGQPKSILVVNTDITEKKKLESQFLRTQRLESIGTLASGIAHDLNNVLGPVLMIAEMLREKILDEKSQVLLKELEVSAKRGANLVKQVLSFARGMEGERTIVQVRHLLLEIQQIAKQTFPKTIEIYTDISSDLWTVSGDATQLHQVLMNLVVNARDAMLDGGTLRIYAENLFVDENYSQMHLDAQVGPYIVITVTDTGMGIPPGILERIFEPFFTTKEVGKGTGLGLPTVLGIIKSHGGFINVFSQIRKGSQFKVFLPAASATETLQLEDIKLPRGNGELILIVDDEAAIRDTTKALLETQNYNVIVASNGIEAIALYAQHHNKIDAVLMDTMMPDMDGPTAICVLQRINPLVSIITVSGLMLSDKTSVAMGTGVKRFLSKPYTGQELLRTIREVLKVQLAV